MKNWLTPLFLLPPLFGQITIVDSGAAGNQVNLSGTYVQDFDSLPSSTPPGGAAWVNNSTIPGWYSTQSLIHANGVTGGLASYGTGSDRALGSVAAYWAVRFVNNSSQNITGVSVSYTGEQWYRGANNPQGTDRMYLYYRIYSSDTTLPVEIGGIGGISNWTAVDSLAFDSPNASDVTAAMLDGNAAANRSNVSFMITGLTLAPGEKIWFKWIDGDMDSFNDHALAIDDLSISFVTIPEPASFAALAGLTGLAVVVRRRRRS